MTDAAGNTWSWEYDLRGRKVSATDADAGTTDYSYDAAGQLITSSDARGVTLGYTYDALGRRTSVRDGSPTGPLRAEWVYDTLPHGKGQLSRSIRYDGVNQYVTEAFGYDEAGRLTGQRVMIPAAETGPAGSYDTVLTYLADGSLATATLPAAGRLPEEKLVYAYNDVGALTEVVSPESIYVYSVAYNKLGELTQRVLGNFGKRTAITNIFDEPTGRLANTSAVPENKPEILDLAYSYDPAGNLLRIADSPGSSLPVETQCFRYDQQRRLVKAWTPASKTPTNCVADPAVLGGPAKYWHDYTYDVTGNRLTQVDHTSAGDITTTYTHPDPGTARPHTVSTATSTGPAGSTLRTFGYDGAGNTIERVVGGDTQTLGWDAEGRVASIADPGGTSSYVYDADGNRLIGRDPGGKTLYLAGQELRFDNAAGVRSGTRYYTHLGSTIAVRTPEGVTWTVTDHHNTGEVMIRESDMSVQRRRTLPFGDTRGTEPTWWAGDKGFVGGTQDPTGLTHLGARLYDPGLGRFVSVDPIMDLTDPQQMHGYAYANNNPTTMSDPDGLCVRLDDRDAPCIGTPNWLERQQKFEAKQRARNAGATGGGGGGAHAPGGTVGPAVDPALAAARAAAEQAKRQLIDAAKTLAKIAMDELGVTAALDCFTNGNLGSCAETALNVAASFVGGLAGKLAAKYGAPWDWKKGAAVARRIWDALGRLTSGVKSWWKQSRLAQRLAKGSCNSFVPGTGVLMADGSTKPIEDVDVGDTVLATDPETGETIAKVVVATIIGHGSKNLVEVTVDVDGSGGDAIGVLIATDGHPFWVPDLNEWVDATDLQAGQWLQTSAGTWIQITAIKRWTQSATVHNLTVADIHTYYIQAGTDVLVHNAGGDACPVHRDDPIPGATCECVDNQFKRGAEVVEGAKDAGQNFGQMIETGVNMERGAGTGTAGIQVPTGPRFEPAHDPPSGAEGGGAVAVTLIIVILRKVL